jgi:transposase-like protein
MNPVGRPKKLIPADAKRQIERLASTGASMVEIASALSIGKDLLRQWVASDESLSLALARGRENERQALHGRLFQSAMDGNVVAALFLLKCRHAGYDDRAARR